MLSGNKPLPEPDQEITNTSPIELNLDRIDIEYHFAGVTSEESANIL